MALNGLDVDDSIRSNPLTWPARCSERLSDMDACDDNPTPQHTTFDDCQGLGSDLCSGHRQPRQAQRQTRAAS